MKQLYSPLKPAVGKCLFMLFFLLLTSSFWSATVFAQHIVSSVSPMSGPAGTIVTITGTGFSPNASENTVTIGTQANVIAASSTILKVVVPSGAGSKPVTVLTNSVSNTYSGEYFTITVQNEIPVSDTISFLPKKTLATSGLPQNVTVMDIDGDGKTDIVVGNNPYSLFAVYRNTTEGNNISFADPVYNTNTQANHTYGLTVADLDNDGKPDVVIPGNVTNTILFFKNTSTPGNISFNLPVSFAAGTRPEHIAAADIDQDGRLDMLVANYGANTLSVFRNTGTGGNLSFADRIDYAAGINPVFVAAGDADNDGKPDIALVNYNDKTLSFFKNRSTVGNIDLSPAVTYETEAWATCVKFGDLNADGRSEMVVGYSYPSAVVSIYRNNSTAGSVVFGDKQDIATDNYPYSIAISDFDGDGRADLAVTNFYAGIISVLKNTGTNGAIAFSTVRQYEAGDRPMAIAAADFDKDGKPDMAVASALSSSVYIFRNRTTEPFLTGFTPDRAATGAVVNITGLNMAGVTAVSFGGKPAASFSAVSPTSISAIVGNGDSGNVSVTTPEGTHTLPGFIYIPPPRIISISPDSAATGGTVTITGANFTGATVVQFGGMAATSFTVVSSTAIKAVIGTGASGDITITTPGGTTTFSGFKFIPVPVITGITPATGTAGTEIIITGNNFNSTSVVSFGGIAADSFQVVSATTIRAIVGLGATGIVRVSTPGGSSNFTGFTYTTPPAPVINGFTPTEGAWNNEITITGSNFYRATAVSFGSTPAISFAVISATVIKARVNVGASGDIKVTTSGGTATASGFVYIPQATPVITSFTPAAAGAGGTVTITGINLNNVLGLSFGLRSAKSFTVISSTTIQAVVGTGNSGRIAVTTPGGDAFAEGFLFIPAPTITSFTPASGGSGKEITISGTDFTGVTAVNFGGVPAASFTVVSATTIKAVVGAGASGNIGITTTGGVTSAAGFTFIPPPGITAFSPAAAGSGDTVMIRGNNFTGASAVKFGDGDAASFRTLSDTSILAVVGYSSTSGNVSITNTGGTSIIAGFTYIERPVISYFYPIEAKPGTVVTISGKNFTDVQSVSFGGVPAAAFTIVSASTIQATVGQGASGKVTVTAPSGSSSAQWFQFIPLPVITSFSPEKSGTDSTVTITGMYLDQVTSVTFGGTFAKSFKIIDHTTIKAVVGSGNTGDIVVKTINGTTASRSGFIYYPLPVITSFAPVTARKGESVTIKGSGFTGTTAVILGDSLVASFVVENDATITAVAGNGESGKVRVSTPGGTVLRDGFVFVSPPVVYSFSPRGSYTDSVVTITGKYFTNATGVSFGGVPAKSFAVVSAGVITAIVGNGSSGSLRVTTPEGTAEVPGFLYYRVPAIYSFTPQSGPVGTTITINGSNFSDNPAANIVRFGAVKAEVLSGNTNAITVKVPAGVTFEPVSVAVPEGLIAFSTVPFKVTFPTIGRGFQDISFAARKEFVAADYSIASIYDTKISDLDGDGKPDIVALNYNFPGIKILRNNSSQGNISFEPRTQVNMNAAGPAYISTINDFNGDGKPDIAVAYDGYSLSVFKNISTPGNISFDKQIDIPAISRPYGITGADVDADGRVDLIVINTAVHILSVYRNTSVGGDISFAPRVDYATGNTPYWVATGDVNGDGKPDIVVANWLSNSISVYKNTSPGGVVSFAPKIDFATSLPPRCLAIADLNNDGKADIAVAVTDSYNNLVDIFKNTGSLSDISFEKQAASPVADYNQFVTIADLDGDSKPDLVTTINSYNGFTVFKNNSDATGAISFAPGKKYVRGQLPANIVCGDIDGDNKPDIVVTEIFNETVAVYRNQLAEATTIPSGNNPVSGPVICKVTVDDVVNTHNGTPYVQRHYDIEPVNNAAMATATITLYFTQQEFDNFNAVPAHGLNLPTGPYDAAGKAALRVYQYHGFSTTSLPGSYSGSAVEINPDDDKIVWNTNSQWWEVTFDVIGFSGFFVSSYGNRPLPVTLLSFDVSGKKENAILQWTTSQEVNVNFFEVQRSIDGKEFIKIGLVTAFGNSASTRLYNYTDTIGKDKTYYYRLRMIDKDEAFSYSKVVSIKSQWDNTALLISPNPARDRVVISHPVYDGHAWIKVADVTGRNVKTVVLKPNDVRTIIQVEDLKPGVYSVFWSDGVRKLSQLLLIQ